MIVPANSTIAFGPGYLADGDAPPIAADPAREYALSSSGTSDIPDFEWGSYDRHCRPQTLRKLKAIAKCPAGQSSYLALMSTVLATDFEFTPSVSGDKVDPSRAQEAARAVEECERAAGRMEQPLEVWAAEMFKAVVERHKLAEIVMALDESGNYVLDRLKVLPRWCYRFECDRSMNVESISLWTVEGTWESIEPGHFVWLSFDAENGDPRGNSLADAANLAFDQLCQLWPETFKYLKQFGSPRTLATTGPKSAPSVQILDENGRPTGRTRTGEEHLARNVALSEGGATIGAPEGTKVSLIESLRDGKSLFDGLDRLEGQIIRSFVLQEQALTEAKHASRADSATKKEVMGTWARFLRLWLCRAVRKPFYEMLKANHGEAYAREFTPFVGLGQTDAEQLARVAQAVAVLYQAGYFTESQLVWLDAFIGLPRRSAGEERVGPQKDNAGTTVPTADAAKLQALFGEIKGFLIERGMPE